MAHPTERKNLLSKGWSIWAVAAIFYAYEFLHRVSPSVMVPDLMEAFDVSRASIGDLAAFYFYAYALFQVPAGMLCDRYGVRLILTLASLLVALGSFMLSSSQGIYFACFSRCMIGAGSAFGFVCCLKIAASWIQPRLFPIIVGLTNLFGMMGAISGGKPLAVLLDILTWRETMLYLGILGMGISALIWWVVKDPPQAPQKHKAFKLKDSTQSISFVLKRPQVWLLAFYGMLLVAPIAGFAEMWGVEFFQTSYCLPKDFAASFLANIFIGIAIGGPLIGWLGSQFTNLRLIMLIGCLITIGTLFFIIYIQTAPFIWIKFALFLFGLSTSNMLLCFSIANRNIPYSATGTAIGFINMMIMAGGAIFQPIIGKLLDVSLSRTESVFYTQLTIADFQHALTLLPMCTLVAICLIYFIKPKNRDKP